MSFGLEVITLVPEVWATLTSERAGLTGRAFVDGEARVTIRNLKEYGHGKHRQVDDAPFGGGAGMVLAVPPLHAAILDARTATPGPVILMGPRGERFSQAMARELANGPGMTLVCGRYEGVDERVRRYVDREVSVGDYVLSAGDPAAWSIVDAVVRLLPGVLGNASSIEDESFSAGLLEYPQYTRPVSFEGVDVPEILRSGDHRKIAAWRREQARALTEKHRPDLLEQLPTDE
ncbi:MAG: tRNA (guanosine(37)-N1)-methyltransferase TrmD [Myxococcota bacterium]|nr:tRNA (guanosine(37)-N1)-methyltransferase TrmD [Myxococcota bacterium]